MPLSYALEQIILRIAAVGDVEYNTGLVVFKEALDRARELAHTSDTKHWNVIFDLRESKEDRSADELRGVAMALSQYSEILTGRLALVAADAYHYGLSRVFGVFAEQLGHEPRVFNNVEEAEAWLAG